MIKTFNKVMAMAVLAAVAVLIPGISRAEAPSPAYLGFFPPAQSQGEITLTLVSSGKEGGEVQVGFGLPFPPGFVHDANDIALFGVDGKEIAIHAKVLATWPEPVPGGGLRSVLIQFRHQDIAEAELTLRWGKSRSKSLDKGWPARDGWQKAFNPDYADVEITEPKAMVLIPREWLGESLLKGRILPYGACFKLRFVDDAFRQRFDLSYSHKSALSGATTSTAGFSEKSAPWLYDRAATQMLLYLKTGRREPLRQSLHAAQFYTASLAEDGRFKLTGKKWQDVKYASPEGLLLAYLLSGDDRMLGAMQKLLKMLPSWNAELSPERSFWTERHLGMAFLTAICAYEMTPDPKLLKLARHYFEKGYLAQTKPLPGAPADGCLIHTGTQHSEGGSEFVCSPWMTTLFLDAGLRYYLMTADKRYPDSVRRMADFLNDTGVYEGSFSNGKESYIVPCYLCSSRTKGERDQYADIQHCLDAAKIPALAYYFAGKLGWDQERYRVLAKDLLQGAKFILFKGKGFTNPPRKFNWWFRTTADLSWLLCD